ncbi:MAG: NUDIX hydrolase [Chloroflexi bacterium]|nr:NUDIX hydrolase [Chloroflexota bacterium]
MGEQLIRSEYLYRGRVITLRLDQVRLDGEHKKVTVREIVEHRGAAVIIPMDDQNRVLMVRQYRAAAARELLEVPAGTMNEGEDPAMCATRELKEETGYQAGVWEPLGHIYSSPGFSTEKMHLFLARQLRQSQASPEEDEDITVQWVPLGEAIGMIERGELVDAKTIVGLLRVARRIDGLRKK